MGVTHFYRFLDREMIEPILKLKWTQFQEHFGLSTDDFEAIFDGFDPDRYDPATSDENLAKRTVGWSLRKSDDPYGLIDWIVDSVPELSERCPSVEAGSIYNNAALDATAVEAYLRGQIDKKTLWAVNTLNGREDPRSWVDLSEAELDEIEDGLACGAVMKPRFPGFSSEVLEDCQYTSLTVPDTKRYLAFIRQAWQENWPVPRLKKDVRKELGVAGKGVRAFRDFELPADLHQQVCSVAMVKPCAFRHFST